MDWAWALQGALDTAAREAALFAACGFLLLGAGDLLVDCLWAARAFALRNAPPAPFPSAARPGRLAVFVPAWREAAVIGAMLRHALAAYDHDDYRIYVGCYPNDPDTVAAVAAVADPRLRLVVGGEPGPTTKAGCLNAVWAAMAADEAREGVRFKAVVLHDAEDVVHSAELRLFDALIERFDLVQLPVIPLIHPGSRWISAHYVDEFAESHGKELPVRAWLGAAIPAAGVGCAFARDALERIAGPDGPFDADSLTEDYELGLRLRAAGGRAAFVRQPLGESEVATRAFFPADLEAAVAQKGRWVVGIALAGWDRLGWSGGLAERWMRLRDRQSILAALLLLCGYATLVLWAGLAGASLLGAPPPPAPSGPLATLLLINAGLLAWRLAVRAAFVTRSHGWREGLRSIPRIVPANAIAMLAARRALVRYWTGRRLARPAWDKTEHIFPATVPAE